MDQIARLTHDGTVVTAPYGTNKCACTIIRPHPSDLTHRLFAPDDPGPIVQLMTSCGLRAPRFVLSDDQAIDCPDCLGEEAAG